MKLLITDPVSMTGPKNIFKLSIEFMEGDADGTQFRDIKIDSELYNTNEEYRNEVHCLIEALDEVIALDREGRGGYDDLEDMINDHYYECNILRFLEYDDIESWVEPLLRPVYPTEITPLMFSIPSDGYSGYYTSFQGYKLTYYNPIGLEFHVNIQK